MRTHPSSDIQGFGRPGRSAKPISGWAIVALIAVALVILTSGFVLLTPYLSQTTSVDDIPPPAAPAD